MFSGALGGLCFVCCSSPNVIAKFLDLTNSPIGLLKYLDFCPSVIYLGLGFLSSFYYYSEDEEEEEEEESDFFYTGLFARYTRLY